MRIGLGRSPNEKLQLILYHFIRRKGTYLSFGCM
jgi:hypothetical protein